MLKSVAVLGALALVTLGMSAPLAAQSQSAVSSSELESAVLSAPATNQATVQNFLQNDQVIGVANSMGVSTADLAVRVSTMDEASLSQVAERTRAAEAGSGGWRPEDRHRHDGAAADHHHRHPAGELTPGRAANAANRRLDHRDVRSRHVTGRRTRVRPVAVSGSARATTGRASGAVSAAVGAAVRRGGGRDGRAVVGTARRVRRGLRGAGPSQRAGHPYHRPRRRVTGAGLGDPGIRRYAGGGAALPRPGCAGGRPHRSRPQTLSLRGPAPVVGAPGDLSRPGARPCALDR